MKLRTVFCSGVRPLLLALLVALPTPAFAVSTTVVISQVYGGGGNTGAPYQNDFVELFNLSTSPVSINGWSIQYASSGNTAAWLTTSLPNVSIQAGQYYLVKLAAGTSCSSAPCGVALPAFDTTGSTNLSGTVGKMALLSTTTALSGACPASSASLVDLVGFGTASQACNETAPTAAPSNTTSVIRASSGCTDTDNNSTDLSTGSPNPRSTATTLHPCVDAAPTLASSTPADSATNVARDANLSLELSEAVDVAGSWFGISCTLSGAHTAAVTGGPTTFTLDPDSDFDNSDVCTVTITATQVTDQDTDDPPDAMASDATFSFTVVPASLPPSGVGLAAPDSVLPGGTTLLTVTVTSGTVPASTGLTVSSDLSTIGGSATQSFVDDGTGADETAADNVFSYEATVSNSTTAGLKSLDFTVGDDQARTGTGSISLTVEPPLLAIHEIQGNGSSSPQVGEVVQVDGIVTARKSNAFFIQTPDADVDGDPATSEGLQVFTSSAPPAAAAVGNKVRVKGTVQEFVPSADPYQPPLTEIGSSPTVTELSTGNDLPAPITLTAEDTDPAGSLEQLERFEGMRVSVLVLNVVAPTLGSTASDYVTATSNGVFQGVIPGAPRAFREPGIHILDPLPTGTPANIPIFDGNPQRLRVDSDAQTGASPLEVSIGMQVLGLVGVVDYGFRTYTILPDPSPTPTLIGAPTASPVRPPVADEFTIGSYNLERFYDDVDDPALSSGDEPVLTAGEWAQRLGKASLGIRNLMRTPDLVGIIEIEGLNALQDLAARINADAVADGQPNPRYQAHLLEGNDIGGIDVGFLVKGSRVAAFSVEQIGKEFKWNDPSNGLSNLNDRPPLLLQAGIRRGRTEIYPISVILVHQRSLSSITDTGASGDRTRLKRQLQSEFLAGEIQARQAARPGEKIVVLGDFNAFEFNDAYVDVMGTLIGLPTPADQVVNPSADLVDPDLANLVDHIPPPARASYVFDGNSQVLDHVLVTRNLTQQVRDFQYARANAFLPETSRNDGTKPDRLSDHDMPVAFFSFGGLRSPASPMALSPGTSAPAPGETIGESRPRYAWSPSLRALKYRIDVRDSSGALLLSRLFSSSEVCLRGSCSVQPGASLAPSRYRWSVTALNAQGESAPSNRLRFEVELP